jgi:hypothetical protein
MVLTDRDVLGRFALVLDAGEIYGPYTRGHYDGFKRKPRWMWVCSDDEIDAVLAQIGPGSADAV